MTTLSLFLLFSLSRFSSSSRPVLSLLSLSLSAALIFSLDLSLFSRHRSSSLVFLFLRHFCSLSLSISLHRLSPLLQLDSSALSLQTLSSLVRRASPFHLLLVSRFSSSVSRMHRRPSHLSSALLSAVFLPLIDSPSLSPSFSRSHLHASLSVSLFRFLPSLFSCLHDFASFLIVSVLPCLDPLVGSLLITLDVTPLSSLLPLPFSPSVCLSSRHLSVRSLCSLSLLSCSRRLSSLAVSRLSLISLCCSSHPSSLDLLSLVSLSLLPSLSLTSPPFCSVWSCPALLSSFFSSSCLPSSLSHSPLIYQLFLLHPLLATSAHSAPLPVFASSLLSRSSLPPLLLPVSHSLLVSALSPVAPLPHIFPSSISPPRLCLLSSSLFSASSLVSPSFFCLFLAFPLSLTSLSSLPWPLLPHLRPLLSILPFLLHPLFIAVCSPPPLTTPLPPPASSGQIPQWIVVHPPDEPPPFDPSHPPPVDGPPLLTVPLLRPGPGFEPPPRPCRCRWGLPAFSLLPSQLVSLLLHFPSFLPTSHVCSPHISLPLLEYSTYNLSLYSYLSLPHSLTFYHYRPTIPLPRYLLFCGRSASASADLSPLWLRLSLSPCFLSFLVPPFRAAVVRPLTRHSHPSPQKTFPCSRLSPPLPPIACPPSHLFPLMYSPSRSDFLPPRPFPCPLSVPPSLLLPFPSAPCSSSYLCSLSPSHLPLSALSRLSDPSLSPNPFPSLVVSRPFPLLPSPPSPPSVGLTSLLLSPVLPPARRFPTSLALTFRASLASPSHPSVPLSPPSMPCASPPATPFSVPISPSSPQDPSRLLPVLPPRTFRDPLFTLLASSSATFTAYFPRALLTFPSSVSLFLPATVMALEEPSYGLFRSPPYRNAVTNPGMQEG
ncbi:hypothetical protein C7M84_021308 [Penaeus vannamei]|uniref:Uncharacterized protein n=1 Tax=Penaeus vannamei TaxID=6689 RepID=A0A423S9S8_PENVA|nr:hypothetical protein C7M84_021308 [Penaeus vannamei]